MTYEQIKPPFQLNFRDKSKAELKTYGAWFHSVLPERLEILAKEIQHTPGYESWRPDLTPGSLAALGKWFVAQVESRPLTNEEIHVIDESLKFPVDYPKFSLTNRTVSLSVDAGMYFSQVLLENHPELKWDLPLRSKNFVDYGQPIIVGFGKSSLNPVRILQVMATKEVNQSKSKSSLIDLYKIWVNLIE